ncbi:MAG TPA: pirin-like C-terminal cupin domain-containing protein [Bacteroidia bacterium]|nr:pirin-like C-terminal cupin domain-containing protein [Bacteroidia bacterium]
MKTLEKNIEVIQRKITRIHTPKDEPGFLGAGHIARRVVGGSFLETDPFIYLMDDILDKKDKSPAGGAHPHAGFETVSLLVDGEITEMMESMKAGDFQIMTAGSGTIHTEPILQPTKGRLFQLWLDLPKKDRWTKPRLQIMPAEHVPSSDNNGIKLRLYSGSLDGLNSPVQNYVSLIVAEFELKPNLTTIQQIPANFNTFIYVISGSVKVGEDSKLLKKNQVGWLNLFEDDLSSELKLESGEEGVRFVLYSAKPLREGIVSYGPFIADTPEDIQELYQKYSMGKFTHISTAPESQRITF